jgi:oleate hydratase
MTHTPDIKKVYLVGGGIASLASALYLIEDAQISGEKIVILEEADAIGGSLDASGSPEEGYRMRGVRMLEKHYDSTYDLLNRIPSLTNPQKTVKDEIFEFNEKVKTFAKARLMSGGEIVNTKSLGLIEEDRLDLIRLLTSPEESLGTKTIADYFPASFFKTNLWYLLATTFAFEPWHSLKEARRYFFRFIHLFNDTGIKHLSNVWSTPYNQRESIVLPLVKWLTEKGVIFETSIRVIDIDFDVSNTEKKAHRIKYIKSDNSGEFILGEHEYVFVTLDSMTRGSIFGSMHSAPKIDEVGIQNTKTLWENIAKKSTDFGKPSAFSGNIPQSKWESFTITFKDPTFFTVVEKLSGNENGTGGLITFTDSNWFITIALVYQPHFINQPHNVQVAWGYALYPDKEGNIVKKKMSECTGEEILKELLFHLRFKETDQETVLKTSICIPCMMPFITSQFMPRIPGDRPLVVPHGAQNFAFIGQYSEIPEDTVFTVEYSVRSAQEAVASLFKIKNARTPLYKGWHDLSVLYNVFKEIEER